MQLSLIRSAKLAELADLAEKHGHPYVQVLTNNLLALGTDPLNPTHVIDLTKETILPISDQVTRPDTMPPPARVPRRTSRRSGNYSIEVEGDAIECASLKEILSEGLKALERCHPGTLDKLSTIKPRSKRIVSRDRNQLFEKHELVHKYSEKLIGDWWFGTNNSMHETLTWLRRGADLAGLEWGKDITTSIG